MQHNKVHRTTERMFNKIFLSTTTVRRTNVRVIKYTVYYFIALKEI